MKFSLSLVLVLLPLLLVANPIPAPATETASLVERGAALNAFLTQLLKYLPALDATIASLVGVLTVFEQLLVLLTGEKITYNDLGSTCKAYTVIFARGTTEPGNVGILVGPPFIMALTSTLGSSSLAIQGVNSYAASVDGYLAGGDAKGSAAMAAQISSAYSLCPNTKLVVSGYSQGAQLVHNALAQVPTTVKSWVSKVVLFGDPYNGTAIAGVASSKVLTYCHVGDNICVNGDLILPAHITYALNAETAATFVAS